MVCFVIFFIPFGSSVTFGIGDGDGEKVGRYNEKNVIENKRSFRWLRQTALKMTKEDYAPSLPFLKYLYEDVQRDNRLAKRINNLLAWKCDKKQPVRVIVIIMLFKWASSYLRMNHEQRDVISKLIGVETHLLLNIPIMNEMCIFLASNLLARHTFIIFFIRIHKFKQASSISLFLR